MFFQTSDGVAGFDASVLRMTDHFSPSQLLAANDAAIQAPVDMAQPLPVAPLATEHSTPLVQVAQSAQTQTPAQVSLQVATPAVVQEAPAEDAFAALGLAKELLSAVKDMGFTTPTTVQLKTIPLAMRMDGGDQAYNDLMVSSQTGSGKTAAFLLPVLHTLLLQHQEQAQAQAHEWDQKVAQALARGEEPPKRPKRKNPTHPSNFKPATPGALVLCPTRELAQQVAHDAIDLVRHSPGLRIANVVGGMPYALQIAKLQNANLVVATPGRLLDLQRSNQIKLDQVQFLVVDEADRMLDLGFSDDLAEVNQLTIKRRQTMMFSATFAPRIQQLATRVMRQPQRVQVDAQHAQHVNITQSLFWADNPQHKRKLLDHWLRDTTIDQAIVFASTQIECDALAVDLQQAGFSAVALHGALSQGLRNRRLMALRQGMVQILVATDVAARGIDVPTISHVFNFGLPMKAEDYVHRIGRTGRAGRDGLAVTFAEFRDRRKIFDIEAYTRQPIKAEVVPGLEPQQRAERPRDFDGPRRGAPGASRFGGRGAPAGRSFDRAPRSSDRHESNDRPPQAWAAPTGRPAEGRSFNDRNSRGPRVVGVGADRPDRAGPGAGKVFVPRDAKKRPAKSARSDR